MNSFGKLMSALFLIVIAMAASMTFVGAASASANLIQNPGFEDQLNFWSISEGTATYSADSVAPHSGSYSAKGVELSRVI